MTQDAHDVRRFSVRRVWLVGLVALAAGGLVWFGIDRSKGEDTSGGDGGKIEPVAATGASSGPASPEQYANFGLEEIVREFILTLYGGETPGSVYVPSADAKLESTDPALRRRGQFELEVHDQLDAALAHDLNYGLLQKSQFDEAISCVDGYGLPSVDEISQLSEEQQEALLEEVERVRERLTEIEDKCYAQARIYAGKDEETDQRLRAQHQFHLGVARAWVEANPDRVAPLPG
ncbi:MAG: hypothetical protein OXF11_10030 [Deltaproteobacteria bacterium]|nr:hypothetical protein [Deltaproteobacteria bacterium]